MKAKNAARRLLSTLLCGALFVTMLAGVFPASAVTSVTQVNLTGYKVPVAGQKPSYDLSNHTNGCEIEYYGIVWWDVTNGIREKMKETDTFREASPQWTCLPCP